MEPAITARAALLQALCHGDGYGLDLIERVKQRTSGHVVLGQGSVYPALRDLEREGLVSSYEGPALAERGGRPRRYYRVTPAGAIAATEHRADVLNLFNWAEV